MSANDELMKYLKSKIYSLSGVARTGVLLVLAGSCPLVAADFTITTPEGPDVRAFTINGVSNSPTITLVRGRTYTFEINTTPGFHPFVFGSLVGENLPFGPTPEGVSGDNTTTGTATFNVPIDAPDCGYYCNVHGFSGLIQMVDPPPPPTVQIVGLTVGTNLVLTSTTTDTNATPLAPEFSTNLLATNWFALTVNTNRFFDGTNETICGRPPGDAIFIRIKLP